MKRARLLETLARQREHLREFKVQSISVFGSFARDEGRAESDVDLLVEFTEPIGMFEFIRLRRYLEKVLRRRVDLVAKDALKPQLRDDILKEAVCAT